MCYCQKMIKSLSALYSNTMFYVAGANIIRDIKSGHNSKQRQIFRTGMKKSTKIQTQVLSNNFPFLCLQLEKISLLRFRLAVAGENMIKNFSFKQRRHMPVVGL